MCVCVCYKMWQTWPVPRWKTPPLTVILLLARTLNCFPYIPLLQESHVTGNDLVLLELAVVNFWERGGRGGQLLLVANLCVLLVFNVLISGVEGERVTINWTIRTSVLLDGVFGVSSFMSWYSDSKVTLTGVDF